MAEPYLSEIRMMAFGFAPEGWALCDGALLSVQQNQALFGLLGTTFGGDGVDTFALPDLRGRTPIHPGGGHALGEGGGEEAHVLTEAELPSHTHRAVATSDVATTPVPGGNLLGTASGELYATPSATAPLHPGTIEPAGGGGAHENRQPFLAVSFCISLRGSLPSPTST